MTPLRALPACLALALSAASPANAAPTFLEWIGVIPAPTYDWENSAFERRRPGHPAPERPVDVIINPGAVNPAPVDQVGEILPLPDRWRIMETLGFKHPWYDPYNQNVWKGDLPMFGDDTFLALVGVSGFYLWRSRR